jgi:hypothetical protein
LLKDFDFNIFNIEHGNSSRLMDFVEIIKEKKIRMQKLKLKKDYKKP